MAIQDLELQLGESKNEDYLSASAAVTEKVIYQIFANGSIALVKKGGTAEGASSDQIEIIADTKYIVKLTAQDIEKLSPYSNLTYKLLRWELLPQLPYEPEIFTGDITLLDRESVPLLDAVKNPRNIYQMTGADVETLEELNALSFAWQTGDMVTLGTNKTLYRYNGTTFEIAPGNCKKYVALMNGGADMNAPITAGPLVVGRVYQITTFATGDNFSNVATVITGTINADNCVFLATGTTPTVYSNGSALIELSGDNAPVATVLENSIGTIVWFRMSTGVYYGYCLGAFPENKMITFVAMDVINKTFIALRNGNNLIQISTAEEGSSADSLLSNSPLFIYVYD